MTALTIQDRLYRLLPSVYRMRDEEQGGPMRALLGVMEGQLTQLRDDIANLYDNWFVETCDEWVVPYIGDLLGVRSQYVFDNESMSLRPFVANTLSYRRRKGTAAMLEGLAHDVTGWPARTVEFFRLLATTQHLNHIRAEDLRTPDLRDTNSLELLGGPFEQTMHFADVRRISTRGGKYNIGNVGIFLWRLQGMPIELAPAIAVGGGRYRFSQLGADIPLFGVARTETSARVVESDMPGPLRARALFEETRAARATMSAGETPSFAYLGAAPVFAIFAEGTQVPSEQIQICDLGDWMTSLPTAESVSLPTEPGDPPKTLTTRVSVDPARGRFVFLSGEEPDQVHVSYHAGFSADIGGGAYRRNSGPVDFVVEVVDPTQPTDDGFLQALTAWENAGRPSAVFEFRGPDTFNNPDDERPGSGIFKVRDFTVPEKTTVTLRAAEGFRPLLALTAPWQLGLEEKSVLTLSGLWVAGDETRLASIAPKEGATLTIEDCTFVPGQRLDESGAAVMANGRSLASVDAASGALKLEINRSLVGRIVLREGDADFGPALSIVDSIIDGCGKPAAAIDNAGSTDLEHVTVFGVVATGSLEASEVIFDDLVTVTRTQIGCVRFSYVPLGSTVPRAYRCQPAFALEGVTDTLEQKRILGRLIPSYTSRHYNDPGYGQLAGDCPTEITTGAEAGREMGAFQLLMQPQRLANLTTSLDEYLRFGLEAGVFLVT